MEYLLKDFKKTISKSYKKLVTIKGKESELPISYGKWSKKEIIGHLIDSAANNHQRFIRSQLVTNLSFPGYEQEKWVKLQDYQGERWLELVELWKSYNLHLLHIVSAMPEDIMNRTCKIGDKEPINLLLMFEDYICHLKHHLEQVLD
jgi:hypothetical protein